MYRGCRPKARPRAEAARLRSGALRDDLTWSGRWPHGSAGPHRALGGDVVAEPRSTSMRSTYLEDQAAAGKLRAETEVGNVPMLGAVPVGKAAESMQKKVAGLRLLRCISPR